jgi:hypothetical protein
MIDEVTEKWRRLHNEELNYRVIKTEKNEMGGECGTYA